MNTFNSKKPWRYEENNCVLEEDNAVYTVDEPGGEMAGVYGYRTSTQQEFIDYVHSNCWKKRIKLVGGSMFRKLLLIFENLLNMCYLQRTSYLQWKKFCGIKKRVEICVYTAVLPMKAYTQDAMQTTNTLSCNKSSYSHKSISSASNNNANNEANLSNNIADEFLYEHDLKKDETEDVNRESTKSQSKFDNVDFQDKVREDSMFIIDDFCELNEFLTKKYSASKCRVYKMEDRLEEYKITTFVDQIKNEDTEEKPKKKQKNEKNEKKKGNKKNAKKEESVVKTNHNDPNIPLIKQYRDRLDDAYSRVESKLLETKSETSDKKKNVSKETKLGKNDKNEKEMDPPQKSIEVKPLEPLISYCDQVTDVCYQEVEPYIEDIVLPPTCRSETLWYLSSQLKFNTYDVHQKVPIEDVLTESEMIDCLDARLTSDELKNIYELGKSVFPESKSSSVSRLNDQQNEEKPKNEKKKKTQNNTANSNNNANNTNMTNKKGSEQRKNSKEKDSKNKKTEKSEKFDDNRSSSVRTRYGMREVIESDITSSIQEKNYLTRFLYEAVQRYHVCQVFNTSLDTNLTTSRIISFNKWI